MGIFGDIFNYEKKKIDEDRVIRDKMNLERDLAEGDVLGTLYEEEKLRHDRRNLDRDFDRDMYNDRFSRSDDRLFREEEILREDRILRERERLREDRFVEREIIEDELLFDEERRMRDDFIEDDLIEDAEDFIDRF